MDKLNTRNQTGMNEQLTMRDTLYEGIQSAQGERIALREFHDTENVTLSYSDLSAFIDRFGSALTSPEFLRHRIAIIMDGSIWSIAAFLTVLCSGSAAVPLNPQDTAEALREKLRRTDSALLIGDLPSSFDFAPVWSYDTLKQLPIKDEKSKLWNELSQREDDEAFLLFTSGTTGTDKCVIRTQRNAAAVLRELSDALAYGEQQLLVLPAYHLFGIEKVIIPALGQGCTLTLSRGIKHWMQELHAYRIREFFAVPAQAALLTSMLDDSAKVLRYVITAGAPLPENTVRKLQRLNIRCLDTYGSSEAGSISHPDCSAGEYETRSGAAGKLREYLEYRLDNPNPEGYGELFLRGPSISPGYLDENGNFLPSSSDGWFPTGDVARVDERRFLYLKGRVKNLIILESGENICPEELEAIFMKQQEIRECQVFAHRDCLCMLLAVPESVRGEAERARLTQQLYKVNALFPSWKRISAFYLCDALPRNSVGKLMRGTTPVPDENERLWLPGTEEVKESTARSPEDAVHLAFQQAFGREVIRPQDDFFALGGDSLCAMSIVSSLQESGYLLSIRELFRYSTPAELTALLDKRGRISEEDTPETEVRRALKQGLVLAPKIAPEIKDRICERHGDKNIEAVYSAHGMHYDDLIRDKTYEQMMNGYFLDRLLILNEPINQETFEERVCEIIRRHPVLRSVWDKESGCWYQVVLKQGKVPVFFEDRTEYKGSIDQKLHDILEEYRQRFACRQKEELPQQFAVWCYRLDRKQCVMLVELTHLYTDRYSEEMLLRELVLGADHAKQDLYHVYQQWQMQMKKEDMQEAEAFWSGFAKEISDAKIYPLPYKDQKNWKKMSWSNQFVVKFERALSEKIREFARKNHVTVSELISYVYCQSLMDSYDVDSLLFRDFMTGRESAPFDVGYIYGYLVADPPCYLKRSDTVWDYHERLSAIAGHAKPCLSALWESFRDVPVAMNKMLFDTSYRAGLYSMMRPIPDRDIYYRGREIALSFLTENNGEYRLEILHADDQETEKRLKALADHLLTMTAHLTGDD